MIRWRLWYGKLFLHCSLSCYMKCDHILSLFRESWKRLATSQDERQTRSMARSGAIIHELQSFSYITGKRLSATCGIGIVRRIKASLQLPAPSWKRQAFCGSRLMVTKYLTRKRCAGSGTGFGAHLHLSAHA